MSLDLKKLRTAVETTMTYFLDQPSFALVKTCPKTELEQCRTMLDLILKIEMLEGQASEEHRLGMEHACALLSLTVHDSDGHPLDQIQLLRWCDSARESYGLNAAPDLTKCPRCGGPADNGHDRELPPNPYLCTRCHAAAAEDSQAYEA